MVLVQITAILTGFSIEMLVQKLLENGLCKKEALARGIESEEEGGA